MPCSTRPRTSAAPPCLPWAISATTTRCRSCSKNCAGPLQGSNEVSLRTTKAALASYTQPQVSEFVPWLQHSRTRVRFFALNIAAEICRRAARTIVLNKNDFSAEFYAGVLELTRDADADVRAQSADVVQHFGGCRCHRDPSASA